MDDTTIEAVYRLGLGKSHVEGLKLVASAAKEEGAAESDPGKDPDAPVPMPVAAAQAVEMFTP